MAAYQLPPPPTNDDPHVRAWLWELYKRNQDILDDDSTITLTGEATGFGTVVNNSISIPTILVVPYLSGIDGGSPTETYPGSPDEGFYGVLSQASTADVQSDTMRDSASLWHKITGVGRHATAGKLVFIFADAGDSSTLVNSIGVITRATDAYDLTTYKNNLDTISSSTAPLFRGIDCDRSTGRYVVGVSTFDTMAGNRTNPWYSDDLVTWTECTMDVDNTITGWHSIWYDDPMGLWCAICEKGMYLSKDGISFFQQTFENHFGTVTAMLAGTLMLWGTSLPSWMTASKDRILMAGQNGTTWEIVPDTIPYTGSLPLRASTTRENDEARAMTGSGYPASPSNMQAAILDQTYAENIVSMTTAGGRDYVCYAPEPVGRTADGGSPIGVAWDITTYAFTKFNGWDDIPTVTYKYLKYINGTWWIGDWNTTDQDHWYRYNDTNGDGPPDAIAGGWTQDSTGPLGVTGWVASGSPSGGVPQRQFGEFFEWPDEGWAFINTDINDQAGQSITGDYWIVYYN